MTQLTVLMTVYNGEKYLKEAIESILNQSVRDFQFLILDNASSDSSRDIISSYHDSRLRLIALPENIGQVAALNKGMDMIDTQYIARMDADDVSLPRRLERQIRFMEENPQVGVCGTNIVMFRERKKYPKYYPSAPEDIKSRLMSGCYLAHPSVIMRKEFFDRFHLQFDEKIGHSEDWELWQRASFCFPLANIPEIHLLYRLHAGSVSAVTEERKKHAAQVIYNRYFSILGLSEAEERHIHSDLAAGTFNAFNRDFPFILRVIAWLDMLRNANGHRNIFEQSAFEAALRERLFSVLKANAALGAPVRKLFFRAGFHRGAPVKEVIKFIIKSMPGCKRFK